MEGAQKPIVVVGSINMDLVANTPRIPAAGETLLGRDFQTHHGGKGANQAVAVGRLGYPVSMIGRVGDDAFGEQLRAGLQDAGVDTSAVAISPGASGVAVIVVAESGENSIVVVPGANSLIGASDLDNHLEMIRSAGMVLAQLEIPLETVFHLAAVCAREGVPLVLDPAPAAELRGELLKNVAWFTPNETEAAFFLRDVAGSSDAEIGQGLIDKGVQGVVLKLGARGAYVASTDGLKESIKPFQVRAVDTTAAGDCFNEAFAVGMLMGKGPVESARFAAAAAAISVTRAGAQSSMPTLNEVMNKIDTAND